MSGGYLGNIYNNAASGNNYMRESDNDELLLKSENKKESFMNTETGVFIGVGVFMGIFLVISVLMVIRYFRMSDSSIIELAKANRTRGNHKIVLNKGHSRHHKHGRGKGNGKIRVNLAL
jgi:hypothetical protein